MSNDRALTVDREEPTYDEEGNYVPAALKITTAPFTVEAVKYSENVASYAAPDLDDPVHRAYDKRMTSLKLGIAQGITFEGVVYRDDIMATGEEEDTSKINSLLDSMGVGEGEGVTSSEAQMRGATSVEEKRLENIRVSVYEYFPETGKISSRLATDADNKSATLTTDDTGAFTFRLRAGHHYIIKTNDEVSTRLIKPTLVTWSDNPLTYQNGELAYDDSGNLIYDNDLRYVSGSARTYPFEAVMPLTEDGYAIYEDEASPWKGYKRQNKFALGYVDGTKGYLGDFVWSDENYNGLQDVGEPGVGQRAVDGGLRVKMETWYYAPVESKLVYKQQLDENGQPAFEKNVFGNYIVDSVTGQKIPIMAWEMEDSTDYAWQLYPGDELREAYTGDAATAGTYLFRDVRTYVIDPRDTRKVDDDYKTKRLAGYRLRIDQDDLNALGVDAAITLRDAYLVDANGNVGHGIDEDSDLMSKAVDTTVIRQANGDVDAAVDGNTYYRLVNPDDLASGYEPCDASYAGTKYVKVMDGADEIYARVDKYPDELAGSGATGDELVQRTDGTNSKGQTARTYYLNEKGSQPERGSFEDGYIVIATIGQTTSNPSAFTTMPEYDDDLDPSIDQSQTFTYTTTYRNETATTQMVSFSDPYPAGDGVSLPVRQRRHVQGRLLRPQRQRPDGGDLQRRGAGAGRFGYHHHHLQGAARHAHHHPCGDGERRRRRVRDQRGQLQGEARHREAHARPAAADRRHPGRHHAPRHRPGHFGDHLHRRAHEHLAERGGQDLRRGQGAHRGRRPEGGPRHLHHRPAEEPEQRAAGPGSHPDAGRRPAQARRCRHGHRAVRRHGRPEGSHGRFRRAVADLQVHRRRRQDPYHRAAGRREPLRHHRRGGAGSHRAAGPDLQLAPRHPEGAFRASQPRHA